MTETLCCSECGIQWCAPVAWVQNRREDHKGFYCPNGHSQYFPGKTAQERRIAQLERELRIARDEIATLLDEWACCPFSNCPGSGHTYASRETWERHLRMKHGVRFTDLRALPPAQTA